MRQFYEFSLLLHVWFSQNKFHMLVLWDTLSWMGYILLSMLDVLLGQMVLICYYYFFTLFFFGFIVSIYCFQCLKIQRKPHVKDNETQTFEKKRKEKKERWWPYRNSYIKQVFFFYNNSTLFSAKKKINSTHEVRLDYAGMLGYSYISCSFFSFIFWINIRLLTQGRGTW